MVDDFEKTQEFVQLQEEASEIPVLGNESLLLEQIVFGKLPINAREDLLRLLYELNENYPRMNINDSEVIFKAELAKQIFEKFIKANNQNNIDALTKYSSEMSRIFSGEVWEEQVQATLDIISVLSNDSYCEPEWKEILNEVKQYFLSLSDLMENCVLMNTNSWDDDPYRAFQIVAIPRIPSLPKQLLDKIENSPLLKKYLLEGFLLSKNLISLKKHLEERQKSEPQNIGPDPLVINPLELPWEKGHAVVDVSQIRFYGNNKLYHSSESVDDNPSRYILRLALVALRVNRGEASELEKAIFGLGTEKHQVIPIALHMVQKFDGSFHSGLLLDGRHRFFAAKLAGLKQVGAEVSFIQAMNLYVVESGLALQVFEASSDNGAMVRGVAPSSQVLNEVVFPINPLQWHAVVKNGQPHKVGVDQQLVWSFGMVRTSSNEPPKEYLFISSSNPKNQVPLSVPQGSGMSSQQCIHAVLQYEKVPLL